MTSHVIKFTLYGLTSLQVAIASFLFFKNEGSPVLQNLYTCFLVLSIFVFLIICLHNRTALDRDRYLDGIAGALRDIEEEVTRPRRVIVKIYGFAGNCFGAELFLLDDHTITSGNSKKLFRFSRLDPAIEANALGAPEWKKVVGDESSIVMLGQVYSIRG